jgi:hypothetical protein
MHPLDLAGRVVPDDLCLVQADADGVPRLVAASLCFPSRWRLGEKLGRPLEEEPDQRCGAQGFTGAGMSG